MAAKPTTLRLHQDIKKEFDKLSQVKEHGVRKYSIEFILNDIAHKYYKSPKTIENIVFNRTETIKSALAPTLFESNQ